MLVIDAEVLIFGILKDRVVFGMTRGEDEKVVTQNDKCKKLLLLRNAGWVIYMKCSMFGSQLSSQQ